MNYVSRFARGFFPAALLALAFLASACGNSSESGGGTAGEVSFAEAQPTVTSANPGEVITVDVAGSGAALNNGFFVRFVDVSGSIDVPPLRVENGRAFVMVPGLSEEQDRSVKLAIVNQAAQVVDADGPILTIHKIHTNLVVTRAQFNDAVGKGLARIVELAREAIVTLDQNGHMVNAQVALDAFAQIQTLLLGISDFTANLDDAQLGMLQQMLGNSQFLDFLAEAGGVPFGSSASQSSPQYSIVMQLVESALLKADFASLLLGEARGMLTMIAWACTQVSSWPIIGSAAQAVATWATGLAATLKTPHDMINTMIPSDLVRITANNLTVPFLGNANVAAKGRFETEGPFNQQWLQQTITTYVQAAAGYIIGRMQQSSTLAPYTSYVSQIAGLVPQWIMNWLTSRGLLSASVVPGQSYTVLALNNLDLDMSMYRFDVAGIVANLLNLPRVIVTTFFTWVGIGYGSPVGGFEGVKVNGTNCTYDPATDRLGYVSHGFVGVDYVGVLCRPATGWWAQWGFYAVNQNVKSISVYVN